MKKITMMMAGTMVLAAACNRSAEAPKYIALSFDDGPNTEITPLVLDVLEENEVKATFFVIGQNINEESAKVMQRAHNMGCDIENHSLTHQQMSSFSEEEIRYEIAKTDSLVASYTGRTPEYFRPPYIDHNELMHNTIDKTFICGAGCNDWIAEVTAEERLETMLTTIKEGDIFLLHDFQGNYNTVEALKKLIPEMKSRGFVFVTIPEIFELYGNQPEPFDGQIYTNVIKPSEQ